MPKRRSRTAQKSRRHLVLSWRYLVPVVGIIVIVGYVVVNLTKASSHYYSKSVENGGLKGGTSTTSKFSGDGTARVVGALPVTASLTAKELDMAAKLCARVYLKDRGIAKLEASAGGLIYAGSAPLLSKTIGTAQLAEGYQDSCLQVDSVFAAIASYSGINISVTQLSGYVSVKEIWVERN